MKNILHFKTPIDENGDILIDVKELNRLLMSLKERLGDEYVIIASPCNVALLSVEDVLYSFKANDVSIEDLKNLIDSVYKK
ncbi:MAG TPA: hypothetical protein DC057_11945 [Spirochaetia bacterium]|nr:hypothetical protein [Spirochaetia bacterium]